MADDWRVTVTLHDETHAGRAARSVHEHKAEDDLRHRLGHRVAVSVDGQQIFLYAGTEDAAREAERVVAEVLEQHQLGAGFALDRWHPVEQDWQDAGVPLPETADARQAEHQRLVAEETRESLASGQAAWEVRVEMPSRHEAVELTARLREEDHPVVRRWRYLLVGANNEDDAAHLAQVIKTEAPAAVSVQPEPIIMVPFVPFGPVGEAGALFTPGI